MSIIRQIKHWDFGQFLVAFLGLVVVLWVGYFASVEILKSSYQLNISTTTGQYHCNQVEVGNPTILTDCFEGKRIEVYNPVNLKVGQ